MHYLFNSPLIRRILKLKYQYFNYKLLGWILLWLSAAISISWGTYHIILWVQQFCSSSLSYIIITGERCYTTNNDIYHMIKKLGILRTLIKQDINVIQKEIEYLPWVQQVSIRAYYPDTLKIHVVEHIPIAFWNDSQAISATGLVFDIPKMYKKNNSNILMPIFFGPKDSEQEMLIYYYIFREILKTSIKLQIKSLKMDVRDSWQIVLKNNIYIKLGRKNVVERLNYFIKIYPILLCKINETNKYIEYIDLRYTTGFVVKWIPNTIKPAFCKK